MHRASPAGTAMAAGWRGGPAVRPASASAALNASVARRSGLSSANVPNQLTPTPTTAVRPAISAGIAGGLLELRGERVPEPVLLDLARGGERELLAGLQDEGLRDLEGGQERPAEGAELLRRRGGARLQDHDGGQGLLLPRVGDADDVGLVPLGVGGG